MKSEMCKPINDMLIKWVPDIGMYAIDRPMKTCVWKSEWCGKHCYNIKFFKTFPKNMIPFETKAERSWDAFTPENFAEWLKNVSRPVKRFRICTRGEPFTNLDDIIKIREIAHENQNIEFWIPTRAFSNDQMMVNIEYAFRGYWRAKIMWSVDPCTNTSLMDGSHRPWIIVGRDDCGSPVKCPKTWEHVEGACGTCEIGCFSGHDVLLKEH